MLFSLRSNDHPEFIIYHFVLKIMFGGVPWCNLTRSERKNIVSFKIVLLRNCSHVLLRIGIVDKKGFDVFGESSNQAKKQYECTCPHCERTLAAQRFAPHLEKCMGMGRNSSRIASKRITASTNSSKSSAAAGTGGDSDLEDNDKSSDNDWNEKTAVKKSRKKKNNGGNGVVKRITSKKGSHSAASSTVTSHNGLRHGDSSSLIETKSEYQFWPLHLVLLVSFSNFTRIWKRERSFQSILFQSQNHVFLSLQYKL